MWFNYWLIHLICCRNTTKVTLLYKMKLYSMLMLIILNSLVDESHSYIFSEITCPLAWYQIILLILEGLYLNDLQNMGLLKSKLVGKLNQVFFIFNFLKAVFIYSMNSKILNLEVWYFIIIHLDWCNSTHGPIRIHKHNSQNCKKKKKKIHDIQWYLFQCKCTNVPKYKLF